MFEKLLKQLPLGELKTTPVRLNGGCSHVTYRLETNQGVYAVKVLNEQVLDFLGGIKLFKKRDEVLKILEKQQFPAISASYISFPFVVYPWVKGELLAIKEVQTFHVKRIAELLADVHQHEINTIDLPFAPWQYLPEINWSTLFENEKIVQQLNQYDNLYRQAWSSLEGQEVLSHGDLNYTNVLWHHNNPCVLDWESLGLSYANAELISNALAWNGIVGDELNFSQYRLMIKSYEEYTQQSLNLTEADFYASWGYWLIWLAFSQKRVLGLLPCEAEQKSFYKTSVLKTLNLMERLNNKVVF